MSSKKVIYNGMSDEDNEIYDPDEMFVTLDLEDGSSEECQILTIYEVQNQNYIVLLPLDEDGNPNAKKEVYLYRYFEDDDGEPYLENIEDDDEYEAAADRFDELQDEMEFDEME